MNEKLIEEINDAIDALQNIKKWINDNGRDEKRYRNITFWNGEMLSRAMSIGVTIEGARYD